MILIEDELNATRRAFAKAQLLLAGSASRLVGQADVGWHGTSVHEESGSVCLVRFGSDYADLVGEYLLFTVGPNSLVAYCYERADVAADISLARRPFLHLAGLYRDTISARVEVRA
ncbi:MAG: hypothetical protein H0U41_05050 [Actinobacteria bacterium]|nr:hypothetical protein [Actinomycetota bacterium]